ncbi:hypothetical protein Droror1_Dr00028329, partial [Drosera rotundifolia]
GGEFGIRDREYCPYPSWLYIAQLCFQFFGWSLVEIYVALCHRVCCAESLQKDQKFANLMENIINFEQ